jgi:hypothetical protein
MNLLFTIFLLKKKSAFAIRCKQIIFENKETLKT